MLIILLLFLLYLAFANLIGMFGFKPPTKGFKGYSSTGNYEYYIN